MRLGLARALLLLLTSAGCGGASSSLGNGTAPGQGDRTVDAARVVRAFTGAGLRRPQSGLLRLFEKTGVLGANGREQLWDADASSLSPSVVVELFPSVRLARYVIAIGGNEETDQGVQIPPVARVGNVVVTVRPSASQDERSRALRAVAILRKT